MAVSQDDQVGVDAGSFGLYQHRLIHRRHDPALGVARRHTLDRLARRERDVGDPEGLALENRLAVRIIWEERRDAVVQNASLMASGVILDRRLDVVRLLVQNAFRWRRRRSRFQQLRWHQLKLRSWFLLRASGDG